MTAPAPTWPGQARDTAATRRTHSTVLDGVRGLAILLVVLSHSWKVWPEEARGHLGPLEALFNSGSVAVSMFFVITGFFVTRAFVSTHDAIGPVGPLAWFIRRLIRLTIQLWVLLAAVWLMARVDPTDTASEAVTRESLISAGTYTWNTYVGDNALEARSDIGALYFLSIDVQFLCAFLLVFVLLARVRRALTVGVLVLLVGSSVWRALDYAAYGWFHATLSTIDRMDSILWGVAAAMLAGRLTAVRDRPTAFLGAGTLLVLGCVGSTAFFGLEAYFTVVGPVIGFATALVVLADRTPRSDHGYSERLWTWLPLVALGRVSLTLFLWHIPVFEAVARHTPDWHAFPRMLVAVAILAVIVILVERLVARPVNRWARGLAPKVPSASGPPDAAPPGAPTGESSLETPMAAEINDAGTVSAGVDPQR